MLTFHVFTAFAFCCMPCFTAGLFAGSPTQKQMRPLLMHDDSSLMSVQPRLAATRPVHVATGARGAIGVPL